MSMNMFYSIFQKQFKRHCISQKIYNFFLYYATHIATQCFEIIVILATKRVGLHF